MKTIKNILKTGALISLVGISGCMKYDYKEKDTTNILINNLGNCYLHDVDKDGLVDGISSSNSINDPKILRYFVKGYGNDKRLGEIRWNAKEMTPEMRTTASRIHNGINELDKIIWEENQK